jgi:hypothetical protein
VQAQQAAERQALSGWVGRDVSEWGVRPTRETTVADLSGRGMLAQQSLRSRLRLPRYRRWHQTLPGPRHLFRCRGLHGGHLWIRLHLRQSRGAQERLRLGNGVSPGQGEVHARQ